MGNELEEQDNMRRTAESVRAGIVADEAAGMQPKAIAIKWGVHRSTVSRLVGIKRKVTLQQAASVLSAHRRGVSKAIIAAELGVSVSAIRRILQGKTAAARKAAGGLHD
jgi:plasmid maintenance system antidote protein VapI